MGLSSIELWRPHKEFPYEAVSKSIITDLEIEINWHRKFLNYMALPEEIRKYSSEKNLDIINKEQLLAFCKVRKVFWVSDISGCFHLRCGELLLGELEISKEKYEFLINESDFDYFMIDLSIFGSSPYCHTNVWIYENLNIKDCADFLTNDQVENFEDENIETSQETIQIFERQIQIIRKGLCKVAVINRFCEKKRDFKLIDNKYYTRTYGNLSSCINIRSKMYFGKVLHNFEETVEFFKQNSQYFVFGNIKSKVVDGKTIFSEDQRKRKMAQANENLRIFWITYPEGKITL
ncbi:MAG: hypothetical protein EBU90_01425 [Proteobacteria bacterium]|nr:hypothetical protein [Pseudomonadota bacterium]